MATSTIISEVEKEIKYNHETKDYDCTVIIDGAREYIGSADSYGEGETMCRDYAYSYYSDNHTPEKAVAIALADEQPVSGPPAAPSVVVEQEDTDWYRYTYGAASLSVEEDEDNQIKYLDLVIGRQGVNLGAAGAQAVRDLAALLHNHDVQNTLRMFHGNGDAPEGLTLARFNPSRYRAEFDNGAIHEYEGNLYRAMVRMGLSDAAMHDLFGHIAEIAGSINAQARMDGYEKALDDMQKRLEDRARRQAA